MPADKKRGNVIIRKSDWIELNENHLINNTSNYVQINGEINDIIDSALKDLINIIYKFKNIFIDWKRLIRSINAGKYSKLAQWRSIPKVHKFKDGVQLKKLRDVISMRDTVTTISSGIVKKIARKIVFELKETNNHYNEVDDIVDIIKSIEHFNETDIVRKSDSMFYADINSMYDRINFEMLMDSYFLYN